MWVAEMEKEQWSSLTSGRSAVGSSIHTLPESSAKAVLTVNKAFTSYFLCLYLQ